MLATLLSGVVKDVSMHEFEMKQNAKETNAESGIHEAQ